MDYSVHQRRCTLSGQSVPSRGTIWKIDGVVRLARFGSCRNKVEIWKAGHGSPKFKVPPIHFFKNARRKLSSIHLKQQ
jgi:hypothetical protein